MQAVNFELPIEDKTFRLADLVELDRAIKVDIRYASTNNFLGRPLYEQARAFLQRPAAEALGRVHASLRPFGYGLLVFDGYRPWTVTRLMAEASPEWVGSYLAHPHRGSRHNRGCAVDLTLYHVAGGGAVDMPTDFDDFSSRAHAYDRTCTPLQNAHRSLLQMVMQAEGFLTIPNEWWHFDYCDWTEYGLLDVPFHEL